MTKLRVLEELGEMKRQSTDWLGADRVMAGWLKATYQKDKGRLCDNLGPKVDHKQSHAIMIGTKMDCRAAKL